MAASSSPSAGTIRVGIGGWTYEPWRGTFYPADLPKARELDHAAEKLTAIEVNGTFYRTQSPKTFADWASRTPDDFVFALKGPRYATNRRVLAEAGESVARFIDSGIAELGSKLGPINWQFAGTKRFNPDDFSAFLALLPGEAAGVALRHAVEVRHDSFRDAAFVEMCRRAGVAIVGAASDEWPLIADATAPFHYLRLQTASEDEAEGYGPQAIEGFADAARALAGGGAPERWPAGEWPLLAAPAERRARDVFVFMINGAKLRCPRAAMALIAALGRA